MRRTVTAVLALSTALALGACGADSDDRSVSPRPGQADTEDLTAGPSGAADEGIQVTTATLKDASGADKGTVEVNDLDGKTEFVFEVTGLPAGFHGLHLHKIGKCEPNSADPTDAAKKGDFLSSGGHLGEGDHPEHSGDLPPLLVQKDGTATMRVTTDRVNPDEILDQDGTAIVVHGEPDNFANIPKRYSSSGPDAETKKAGDAGPRVACGAFTPQ